MCSRDYFVAETPRGEIVWIYRDHRYGIDDGEWFLHGHIRVSGDEGRQLRRARRRDTPSFDVPYTRLGAPAFGPKIGKRRPSAA